MGVYIQVDYTNNIGEAFKIEIIDSTYSGVIYQVQGKAVLDRPKVKTMDMLRGSSLKIQLETSSSDTWITRLVETVGDKKLLVKLYKSSSSLSSRVYDTTSGVYGVYEDDVYEDDIYDDSFTSNSSNSSDLLWTGWVKPDGIVESFVSDYWIVNIQAIDGLGLLENISFLNSDGDIYQNQMSEIDILTRCLELTGLSMQFRIYYINLFYTVDANDPVIGNQALETTYVNVDRYVKDDKESSVFTAKEVLESILKKYGCFITQQNGVWNIVRIIDFYTDDTSQRYALYTKDGVFVNDYSTDLRTSLGSDIDDYDPCHAGANQSKTYKAALGAYKVYYEYGLVASILENPKLYFNDGVGDIDGWTVETALSNFDFVFRDAIPGWASGYYEAQMQPLTNSTTEALSYDYTTYDNDVEGEDSIKVTIKALSVVDITGGLVTLYEQYCKISLIGDSGTVYYLNQNSEWTLSDTRIQLYRYKRFLMIDDTIEATMTIQSNAMPEDGTINVIIYLPKYISTDNGSYTVIQSVNVAQAEDGIKGESWTARKLTNVTAIVDTEDKVYVGDNDSDVYIGAITDSSYDETLLWSKLDAIGGTMDTSKQFPLLNWLARDRMTISGGNQTVFKGDILGYLPYLGVLEINNVDGIFMTTAWSYDTAANKITAEHERIFTDDIYSSVEVEFALESDNVIKPSIE